VLPALDSFDPDFLMISAGFDAHRDDPLAGLSFDDEDYVWVTRKLMGVADRYCDRRLISVLEGGYDHAALARSVALHVATLMKG